MTNKIFYIACVVAVIVIIGLGLGYRIQPNLSISKNASLTLNIPLKNTEIYIDNKKIKTTEKDNEKVILPISLSSHTITTNREGYFPWIENIEAKKSDEISINPVFVTSNTTGMIITQKDPEYWKGEAAEAIINAYKENLNSKGFTYSSLKVLSKVKM
jgi:uncharacterized membrane protein YvbJ